MTTDVIEAAGGLVWRRRAEQDEVAVLHRGRHDDWTLPKGKRKRGETWHETALREVAEETGCDVEIGDFAGCVSYVVERIPKVVLFWHMELAGDCVFEPSEEVDELRWFPVPEALEILSYQGERNLLESSHGKRRKYGRSSG